MDLNTVIIVSTSILALALIGYLAEPTSQINAAAALQNPNNFAMVSLTAETPPILVSQTLIEASVTAPFMQSGFIVETIVTVTLT